MRREFLQLAKVYEPAKHPIAGWMMSEKLDGTRCFWDGGMSRGLPTATIPWASTTDPKTGRPKGKIKPISTGLWSRYGNPIIAPEWFLDLLPPTLLDGELTAGRGGFQITRSAVGCDEAPQLFERIRFAVYSSPSLEQWLQPGEIKNTNQLLCLDGRAMEWATARVHELGLDPFRGKCFREELQHVRGFLTLSDRCYLLAQYPVSSEAEVGNYLNNVLSLGGEGLMLRDPEAAWTPKRVKNLLKHKPHQDAEAWITGFTAGKGKYLGHIGALVTEYDGKRLELSGMTDEERRFAKVDMGEFAAANPGKDMPATFSGEYFHIGDTVTFKYRELTDAGIPKEARYFRQRNGGD